jgi:DNA-binding transcriptional LysR family regulator
VRNRLLAWRRRTMTNIPTELLRTFVAVFDMRSFTRAAQSLGITQPAVSAQVKRLQQLIGGELMDKSAPGVTLTPMGEHALSYARRMLAINDQILSLSGVPAAAAHSIRVGVPGDFVGATLWRTLARSRDARPDLRFHVKSSPSEFLLRDVRDGELDLAITVSAAAPHDDARFHWIEQLVWVRAPLTEIDPGAPVPLVTHGDKCVAHRRVAEALERAGRAYNLPFTETSLTSLNAAVGAGLGVMALPRCVSQGPDLVVWNDAPLPELPAIVCNVCVRAGAHEMVDQFARRLAESFMGRPSVDMANRAAS